MLPSRLFKFKNHGIPPPLRSLMVIHPSLSPSIAVQLRLRLRVASQPFLNSIGAPRVRRYHSSSRFLQSSSSGVATSSNTQVEAQIQQEPKLQLTFTCTVPNCSERSSHEFTKRAYTKGIVIVQCPKCQNRHLIADHLGWFKTTDGTGDGSLKTIEDIMKAKGEVVSRGRLDSTGVVEYVE